MRFIFAAVACFFCVHASVGQEVEPPPPTVPATHPAQEIINQAAAAFRVGKGNEAMKLFIAAREEHRGLAPGEVLFAQLAFASNQRRAARNALELAAINHPEDPEAWNQFADLALREKRFAEASVLFEKALGLAKKYDANSKRKTKQLVAAHGGLALIYQQRKDWKSAESHLRDWIKLDELNTIPWRRLATVFFATDRFDTAKKTLENMRSFAKDQPPAEISMGLMYQQVGKQEEAEKSIRAALQSNPDDFATQLAAARWAMTSGKPDLLKQCAGKAKELRPDAAAVEGLLGMAERFAGNSQSAETIFAKMLEKNPASFDGKNGLALSLLAQDDAEKHRRAAQHAQVLVKSFPDQRTARGRAAAATLAWALHRMDQNVAAEKLIKSVITSGEISPEVGYFAAAILANADQKPLAKQLLTAALKSRVAFPETDAARELLNGIAN